MISIQWLINNVFLIKNNNLDDMKVYLGDSKIFPFYALDDDIFLAHKGGDLIKASFSKDIILLFIPSLNTQTTF